MISIREMAVGDLSLGMSLSREAGWNQTSADWRRFLQLQPGGCFVAEWSGAPVATVTACVFDDVAWIGMMLVRADMRRRGIGRALMERALGWLGTQHVDCVRLDATDMGQPLYETLGFAAQFELVRFSGKARAATAQHIPARVGVNRLDDMVALDREVIGYDRSKLFRVVLAEDDTRAYIVETAGRVMGYVCTRPGIRATFIGPCLAETDDVGRQLWAVARRLHVGERVFVDVPFENRAAVAAVESSGMQPARRLRRMTRGRLVAEKLDRMWASSGPEKG